MRVLLAEDEKRMAMALVAILKQEKYDVDHFADGESALLALESGIYDIAVLDVMMPALSGFEVARRARGKGIRYMSHRMFCVGDALQMINPSYFSFAYGVQENFQPLL